MLPAPPFRAFRRPWPREATWLCLITLAGLALRLGRAWHADWYWDEGYVTEISLDLAHFQRPHGGALWFNGLLPLTASWLAPLSIVPFHWLVPGPALWAVRVWGCCLDAVSLLAVGWIGRALGGWRAGLAAALLLALGPLAVSLGALGTYHHLGSTLALLAWAAALACDDPDLAWPNWSPYALAGLSCAACYWLWWVPLGLCLWRPLKSPGAWILRVALAFGPAALLAALTLGLGGGDAAGMARNLGAFVAVWRGPVVLLHSALAYPMVWAGLALLLGLPPRQRWAWAVWLGLADAVRQRGDLTGSPYLLLVLLPWASLGAGLAVARISGRSRAAAWLALALGLGLASIGSTEWLERQSAPPDLGRNLTNFIRAQHLGDATVVATPNVNWALRGICRPVEPSQATAWRGWSGGFLPGHLSEAAFAYDPSLEKAHFLVLSHIYFDSIFLDAHVALEILVAEYEGWPMVFKNPAFVVYANPRFGPRRYPEIRILHDPIFYWKVAATARQLGRPEWAAFARARAQAGFRP
jgi:hypothetical protein